MTRTDAIAQIIAAQDALKLAEETLRVMEWDLALEYPEPEEHQFDDADIFEEMWDSWNDDIETQRADRGFYDFEKAVRDARDNLIRACRAAFAGTGTLPKLADEAFAAALGERGPHAWAQSIYRVTKLCRGLNPYTI